MEGPNSTFAGAQESPCTPPTLPLRSPVRELSTLLNTTWRITIKGDERTFVGRFLVVDKRKNVILDETVEELDGRSRNIGLVMLPGDRIESAEVDRDSIIV